MLILLHPGRNHCAVRSLAVSLFERREVFKSPADIIGTDRTDVRLANFIKRFEAIYPVIISQGRGRLAVIGFRILALVEWLDIKTVDRCQRIVDFRIIDRRVGNQLVRIGILQRRQRRYAILRIFQLSLAFQSLLFGIPVFDASHGGIGIIINRRDGRIKFRIVDDRRSPVGWR